MKTSTIHFLCMAAAVAATSAVATPASSLPRKASSEFGYKYEMLERPDQQDLDGGGANDFTGWNNLYCTLGSGQDVGTFTIGSSTENGKNLISNQAVGTNGDGWRALGASSSTGFTVETRLKITECTGVNGAICVEAGPSDSKVYARLNFFSYSIGWNGTTLTNVDTSAYHTYRIVREGGTAVHSVWVDGVLVAENLGTGFTYNNSVLYRMLLGSPGSGWTGKAQVAYLRFCEGGYAPPDPNDKSLCKASTDFSVKYEMDDSDNSEVPLNGSTGSWKTGGTGATISKNVGVLSVITASKSAYWDTTDAIWKNLVTSNTAYTAEFKVKINSSTLSGVDRSFSFTTGSPGAVGQLFLGTNSVQWCLSTSSGGTYVTLNDSDNTDDMHTFRIAYEGGNSRHGFTIWRDGVKIGEDLVDCVNFYKYSGNALGIVRFGKAGGLNDGSWDLDYIRWDIGNAYEWKEPPKAFTIVFR